MTEPSKFTTETWKAEVRLLKRERDQLENELRHAKVEGHKENRLLKDLLVEAYPLIKDSTHTPELLVNIEKACPELSDKRDTKGTDK